MSDFRDYIADTLTSAIAEAEDCSDVILYTADPDAFVYVDPEAAALYVITVKAAKAVVAGEDEQ